MQQVDNLKQALRRSES